MSSLQPKFTLVNSSQLNVKNEYLDYMSKTMRFCDKKDPSLLQYFLLANVVASPIQLGALQGLCNFFETDDTTDTARRTLFRQYVWTACAHKCIADSNWFDHKGQLILDASDQFNSAVCAFYHVQRFDMYASLFPTLYDLVQRLIIECGQCTPHLLRHVHKCSAITTTTTVGTSLLSVQPQLINPPPIKVLNLILYSDTEDGSYQQMRDAQNAYLKNMQEQPHHCITGATSVLYFYCFYTFTTSFEIFPNGSTNTPVYMPDSHMLYIYGTETIIPGILDKTLQALQWAHDTFKEEGYDYIVRSNVSTIVNFNVLHFYLLAAHSATSTPLDFGGPRIYTGFQPYAPSGMIDRNYELYHDHAFIFGACMIFSQRGTVYLLAHRSELLSYTLVDDAAIGVFLYSSLRNAAKNPHDLQLKQIGSGGGCLFITGSDMLTEHDTIRNKHQYIMYRIKTENRMNDVQSMKILMRQLCE